VGVWKKKNWSHTLVCQNIILIVFIYVSLLRCIIGWRRNFLIQALAPAIARLSFGQRSKNTFLCRDRSHVRGFWARFRLFKTKEQGETGFGILQWHRSRSQEVRNMKFHQSL
jgi:hypothetical protein